MTTYKTGNKLGSTDPKDLYDNAENLDEALNNRTSDYWTDRLGVKRQTWSGIERSGGIKGFATLADLQASPGQAAGQLAYVTNDAQNNGMYRWSGSAWVLSDINYDYVNINNADFEQLANSIDEIVWSANYFINDGSVTRPVERGFPIRGSGGFLTVKRNRSFAVHQEWVTYNGSAYRWGSVQSGEPVWQPWNIILTKKKTEQLINEIAGSAAENHLVLYGSSTLWYLSSLFQGFASDHHLVLKNHAISGDTIYGAAQALGTNEVEVEFPSGQIVFGSQPIHVSSTYGGVSRHNRTVVLNNGVRGVLGENGATFTPDNLIEPLTNVSGVKFKVSEPNWTNQDFRGIYIINIGKNNVTSADNSDWIVEKTIEMIEFLPKNSKFLVIGHFSNTNSNDEVRATIESINEKLYAKYGLRYLDINKLLFSDQTWTDLGITKTPEDIAAIDGRRLPPSLARDNGHLSAEMDVVLFDSIVNRMAYLNYI
ncbi:hypothetical protein CEQ07_05250 [Oligella urethralis]|uniref:hypothetical protein n=1 Tax=Oligella urethralis TaxID=90245 RepID=UPI000CFFB678|nr:hypothetical protein [Oligella urethralis]AVL70874.1 hypothetical protein CEQ07_05250 [Oligella urethralis]